MKLRLRLYHRWRRFQYGLVWPLIGAAFWMSLTLPLAWILTYGA
jgi:hypothetical protein